MRLTLKRVAFIALTAFFLGSIPTLYGFLREFAYFPAGSALAAQSQLSAAIGSALVLVKKYALQIIVIYTIIIGCVIFLENKNPDRTILWLLTLVLLPVVGLFIYFIMGPDFSYQKLKRAHKPHRQQPTPQSDVSCNNRFLLERLLYSASSAEITIHNKIRVFTRGQDKYAALKEDLQKAVICINIQYFIYRDDSVGLEIGDILMERANAGVRVRLLYDAVGSWKLSRSFIRKLTRAGVECHSFMPMAFPRLRGKMNFRNHRKIVVVDHAIAYTGGFNIGKEYLGEGPLGNWRDTHVRLEGDAVRELNMIFLRDWCFRTGEDPSRLQQIPDDDCCGERRSKTTEGLPVLPMQVVHSGVDSPWHPISQGFFNMISRAKTRIWITSPYLVPGASFIKALTNTSLTGVDVRILLPAGKDHFLTFWGSRSNFEDLLRAGVRIYLYDNGFIHAKTLVSDEDICSVGTCNMDARSLDINFENQLFIYDKQLNDEFAEQFEKDLQHAREIVLEEWLHRPFPHKVIESFARLSSAQI